MPLILPRGGCGKNSQAQVGLWPCADVDSGRVPVPPCLTSVLYKKGRKLLGSYSAPSGIEGNLNGVGVASCFPGDV